MAGNEDLKEFPDVSHKLAAPKKLSAFEKERQAAEEKRKRNEAENAAALKSFEESFGGSERDDDDARYDGFPRTIAPPSAPRGPGMGSNRFGAPSNAPRSGPGSLGPISAPPPPKLGRKRALDEMREAQVARRERHNMVDELGSHSDRRKEQQSPVHDEDEHEDVAPRPTVQLSSLPPSTTIEDVRALLREHLPVHSVHFHAPSAAPFNGKKSLSAIATLSPDTSTTQIDTAASALKDRYLGNGFRLSISRHLTSTSLLPTLSSAPPATTLEPFNAQKPTREQPGGGFSMRNAPPPSDYAASASYDTFPRSTGYTNSTVVVQPPFDIATVRAIHAIVDRLLSEPDPARALELEVMLMALPEVQCDERFSFLYDSRSSAGIYYRYLLWNDCEGYTAMQERNQRAKGVERLHKDIMIEWVFPAEDLPFADLSKLGEVVDHLDYQSSEEDSEDGDAERRPNNPRKGDDGPGQNAEPKHLTPLQVAKFAWLLSRMPSNHATLRKGNIAAVTSFAINHAGAGAEEIVDMMILNVMKSFTHTQCAHFDSEDVSQDEDDVYEPDDELPLVDTDQALAQSVMGEKKEAEDPSAAKLVALYLINDVLHNSSTAGVRNAWKYRQLFENAFRKQKTFEHLGQLDRELGWGRIKTDKWRRQIGVLFEIWERNSVFASEVFMILKSSFFDQPQLSEASAEPDRDTDQKKLESKWMDRFKRVDGTISPANDGSPAPPPETSGAASEAGMSKTAAEDLDGVPMEDLDGDPMEDLDGDPMDDLDGDPMEDLDGVSISGDVPMADASQSSKHSSELPVPVLPKTGFSIKGQGNNAKPLEVPKRRKLAEDMFAESDEE